jgi:hypothetical protein
VIDVSHLRLSIFTFAFQSEPPVPTTVIPTKAPEAFLPSAWKQQGLAIVGDAAGDFMAAVALSADARTLVVGASGWNIVDREGYVKVYRADEDGQNRVQLGQTIYGNANGDLCGWSVDVTAEGNSIVLGCLGNDIEDRRGYVRVSSLDSNDVAGTGTWKQIGQDITGEAIGDLFGKSVSISDDGKTIAVGADINDGKNGEESGHVRIFRLEDDGTSWKQIGEDIDGDMAYVHSGTSVSLSANGLIVAIGGTGQVKVYQIDIGGSSWEQLGQSIYGDDYYFGWSVDISPDGNSLAVGSPEFYNGGPGCVKVFILESGDDLGTGSWKQFGQSIYGEAKDDQFGYSVSLSDDAKTLAIGGCNHNDGTGHVRVYHMDDPESSWMQLGEDMDGEDAYDFFGVSVSLSADGSKVAIASTYGNDDDSGQVTIFVME